MPEGMSSETETLVPEAGERPYEEPDTREEAIFQAFGTSSRVPKEGRFTVRPADERDLIRMLRIEKECFSDPWSINIFRGALSEPHAAVYVLLDEADEVSGYAVSTVVLDEGSLDNLAVTASKRGQGAGRMLLMKVLEDARNKGAKRVFLEVRESNARALKLYEKAGFTRLSVRKAYYQDPVEDAVIMELKC